MMRVLARNHPHVHRHHRRSCKRSPELLCKLRVKGRVAKSEHIMGEGYPVLEERPPGHVQRHLDQRFVQRKRDGRETPYPKLTSKCPSYRLPNSKSRVLYSMVCVDFKVS